MGLAAPSLHYITACVFIRFDIRTYNLILESRPQSGWFELQALDGAGRCSTCIYSSIHEITEG